MKQKIMNQKENRTVLICKNYIILLIGTALIIIGYMLMSGKGSTLAAYNPDIFSTLRIRVAPLICLAGYLINVFGILFRFPSIEHDHYK